MEKQTEIRITGLTNDTAKAFYLLKPDGSPILTSQANFWLLKNDQEALKIKEIFNFWQAYFKKLPCKIYHFPRNLYSLLFDLIHRQPLIIFGSLESLAEPIPSPGLFKKKILTLEAEQKSSPQKLAQELTELGYEFNRIVELPGRFSHRGALVDLFPLNFKNPVRLEFFGQTIINLKSLDLATKKLSAKLEAVEIIPMALEDKEANIFDYLTNASFLYSDPENFEDFYPAWPKLNQALEKYKRIVWQAFGKADKKLDYHPTKFYHNNLNLWQTDLKKYLEANWKIIIGSGRPKELKKFFREKDLPSLPTELCFPAAASVLEGFQSKKNKTVFFTDREIFGRSTELKTKRNRTDLAFIAELKPGDYLVHLDHGIARFKTMATQEVAGIKKEYFILEYADNDKLFVPVETADKISKYLGLAQPKLHRLSSSNWYQITHRVKEEAMKIAQELLKIYAQRETSQVTPFGAPTAEEKELWSLFPYEETPDQKQAIEEVVFDLEQERPMDRLICGDVGFGKTEIAIRAAFKAVMNNKQVALLSPTTILTQQHFDTFKARLKSFPVAIDQLSRFQSESQQKEVVKKIKDGTLDIVIGTHRLISKDIKFKNLGLIIVDEEQRFGVKDKEKLKSLRSSAHVLTLTATPIPRTLNLALSGLRDVSIIQTPPEGRLAIETLIEPYAEEIIKKAISNELKRKGQVYFVYNKVETINLFANHLKKLVPTAKIGIAHGQLPEEKLVEVMKDFDNQKINVLVCSTIIENGLDLPNVNTILVENASRFGLAQLYQLRGRIGRSERQAYAYFLYHAHKLTGNAKKRLQALIEAKELGSGFQLAMRDLEIRGTGNILGKEQHGKIAAIGLNLYARLLNQAVEELKTGRPLRPIREITIDLPLEIAIPKSFIPNEGKRLKLYQILANLSTLEELRDFKQKEFGRKKLPQELDNLLNVLELKILAQDTEIYNINTSRLTGEKGESIERIIIKFNRKLESKEIEKVLTHNSAWILAEDQIKIDKNKLGPDWLADLKKCAILLKTRL